MQGSVDRDKKEMTRPVWQTEGDKRSQYIFIGFVAVTIIMLAVVIITGAYGYYSWQEWKRGPQIGVEEGLFEFHGNGEPGVADITVHVTLVNQGKRDSGTLTLEWLVMEEDASMDNRFITSGSKGLTGIHQEENRRESFDVTLGEGEYIMVYRVYEDDLFSYEGRQRITVGPEDVEHEEPDTVTVPEFPHIMIPVILILIIVYILKRSSHDREERR